MVEIAYDVTVTANVIPSVFFWLPVPKTIIILEFNANIMTGRNRALTAMPWHELNIFYFHSFLLSLLIYTN
jgi:hypothetical protein